MPYEQMAPQLAIDTSVTVSNDNIVQGLKHLSGLGLLPKKRKGTSKGGWSPKNNQQSLDREEMLKKK